MSKRNSKLLLEDILDAANKIRTYLSDHTFETFSIDTKTIDAVIRNFEIIGEAANRLPLEFKTCYDDVEWVRIIGFRNRIIHDYMGVDLSIVWNIAQSYLPKLEAELHLILLNYR